MLSIQHLNPYPNLINLPYVNLGCGIASQWAGVNLNQHRYARQPGRHNVRQSLRTPDNTDLGGQVKQKIEMDPGIAPCGWAGPELGASRKARKDHKEYRLIQAGFRESNLIHQVLRTQSEPSRVL